jgi:hypothetical protein
VAEPMIVRYTEGVAREMAATFAGDHARELRCWLRIAHQREAMVTELYGLSELDARLRAGHDGGAGTVVRSAVTSIWAHEESHTRFLGALRSLWDGAPDLAQIQGQMEGKILRSILAGGAAGRALVAIGASIGRVPEFIADLGRMNLRQLIEFFAELETTARMGYQRMLELLRVLDGDVTVRRDLGYTFPFDVARILLEERFHEDAFGAMSRWVGGDGESFAAMSPGECAGILHDLAERNLSVAVARRALDPAAPLPKGPEPWVSDGGLGPLFREHGLSVTLESGPWRPPGH